MYWQGGHAVEIGGAGYSNAEGADEPPCGVEGVGQAKHPGADDEDDDDWMDMESVCTNKGEHAVESGGTGSGNAEGVGEPPRGAEGVGQAKHPGADHGDDDVVFTV